MVVDKYTTMNIRLSHEEYDVLEQAVAILKQVNEQIDSADVDEIRLSDNIDKNLLHNLEGELTELSCSIEF